MNRWKAYEYSPTPVLQDEMLMRDSKTLIKQEVFQHATVGDFIGSNVEGSGSGFIRCVYTAKNTINSTVTLLCDIYAGCCERGCCPQDLFWMTGVFVLLVFVLFVFAIGACVIICCYWRTKRKQRREAYEYSIYGSQIGMHPDGYNFCTNRPVNQSPFNPSFERDLHLQQLE
ncbi:unnamed protein product [Litomosoides sigmodontis]|uniref:CX domain-containing protein n=1 Tax=Litomosoides sigmodontis TaxID=42156 RepID=A0A3P6SDV1_LITSI|nr:unnamed protein product [Litomosoides sigmodontis]